MDAKKNVLENVCGDAKMICSRSQGQRRTARTRILIILLAHQELLVCREAVAADVPAVK